MYQVKSLEDTIVAISTPAGQGGIGVVRLSGQQALAVADQMFSKRDGGQPSSFKNFTVHYGHVFDKNTGETIDEALLTVMRAPKSYTKEDVVEISCHGGMVSLKAILTLATELGARLAEPGEFTKRAFLNGRIDLTQAEAVLDIIQAKTDAFLQVSTHQLKGDLSTELESIRTELMDVYVEMEALINFPEDEIKDSLATKNIMPLKDKISSAQARVERLLQSSDHGQILKEGIKIVICGKPNVGKSSLLNVLLKTPRAIVSDIAGTTRDTIEESANIQGIPFQLIDTAGLLEPRNSIEEEAVKRSHMHIKGADIILFVFDAANCLTKEDEDLMGRVKGHNVVIALNKCDLDSQIDASRIEKQYTSSKILKTSATERLGIEALEKTIVEHVWHDARVDTHGLLVSNVRHIRALSQAQTTLARANTSLADGLSLEFVSEELKAAINCLDQITGRNIDADLLDTIFSQFCVGK